MKHTIYFAFLLICLSIHAQNKFETTLSKSDSLFSPKLTGEIYAPESRFRKGDSFFNSEWIIADVLLSTGEKVFDVKLKYNGFLDEVVWMNSYNSKPYIVDRSYISDFWLKKSQDSILHFQRITLRDTTLNHQSDVFVEVATEGKLSVYIQHKINRLNDEMAIVDGVNCFIKVFHPKPLYYIRVSDNQYVLFKKLGKRSFLKLFPEQKKAISELIREHHLDLYTEKGLVKVVELMNGGGLGY